MSLFTHGKKNAKANLLMLAVFLVRGSEGNPWGDGWVISYSRRVT